MLLSYSAAEGIAVVPRWRLVLPPDYADWLRRMSVVAQLPDQLWLWDETDLPLVRIVLGKLLLTLQPQPGDAPSALAFGEFLDVLAAGYEAALATEDGIDRFTQTVRTCDWEAFTGTKVVAPLAALMGRAFEGDRVARSLSDYLGDRFGMSYDWREAGTQRAFILSSGIREFGGRTEQTHEHLAVLPDQAAWVTIRTRTLTTERARSHPEVDITHYRVVPFLGRLRVTPGGRIEHAEDESRALDAWRSVLSLPGLEEKLSPLQHPYAFSVSFLPWVAGETGASAGVVLERVVGSVATTVSRSPSELDLPGLLCEDPLGTRFLLETHHLQPDNVPLPGDSIRFIARRTQEAGRTGLPVYELVSPAVFGVVDEDEYWAAATTAIVKMHFSIQPERLGPTSGERAGFGLSRALARGWISQVGQHLYYRYVGLGDQDCRDLWANRSPQSSIGRIVERLRPRIHPLFGWVFGSSAVRAMQLRTSGGPADQERQISAAIDADGHALVGALGRDRLTLRMAIARLAASRRDLTFERADDVVRRGLDNVPRTLYRIARIQA
jgi:hypothetical protein